MARLNSNRQPMLQSHAAQPLQVTTGEQQQKVVQCPSHGSYTAHGVLLQLGAQHQRMNWTICPACEQEQHQQAEQTKQQQRNAQRQADWSQLLGRSCLPKRFINKTFGNFNAYNDWQINAHKAAQHFANHFSDYAAKGQGLIFLGKPGTGKSHLAAAIMQKIMPRYSALYTTVGDCIRAVRGTWHASSTLTEQQVLNQFIEADLLVLDEVGVQYGKQGERIVLFDILDGRYRELMPTILIGNVTRSELCELIGERAYDRLRETSTAHLFDWPSYRAKARATTTAAPVVAN